MASYSVPLKKVIEDLGLEKVYMPEKGEEILLESADINRPGMNLTGYMEYFDASRIQIFGISEVEFLKTLPEDVRRERLQILFSRRFPAIIIARNLEVCDTILEAARNNQVPVLRTAESTSAFLSGLISYLNVELAPRITRHGVLVEAYGEGMLLLGESGVGKSETAIELVKRGHRLIADDAVEIRRVSNRTLVGSSPDNIRHFMELRGIGIVNARHLFGIGSVKMTEKIDLVVKMEPWNPDKVYDRMGLETEYTNILGIEVPSLTIPVKPGRNLAIILEVAAMNSRQKRMGYNAAEELLQRLGMGSEPGQGW